MPALNVAICREGSTLLQYFINLDFEVKIWRESIRNLSAVKLLIRILRDFTQEFLTKFTISTYILETFAANAQKTSHIREVKNTTPNTSGQLGSYLAGGAALRLRSAALRLRRIESDPLRGITLQPPLQFISLYRKKTDHLQNISKITLVMVLFNQKPALQMLYGPLHAAERVFWIFAGRGPV
jgi:hypothetical protein